MVSHLVFYQLMFLGLLWLCVMLPLCLAKRVYRRGSEALPASATAAQALPRPATVSWSHP